MKSIKAFHLLIAFFFCISSSIFSQNKMDYGDYQPAIDKAVEYLKQLKEGNAKAVKKQFVESGFQSKADFNKVLNGKNAKWAEATISKFGIPSNDEIAISVWKVSNKQAKKTSPSINVSFYFKEKGTDHDPTNDRISINLVNKEGAYFIDGLLFFKKEDYDNIKKIISDMP